MTEDKRPDPDALLSQITDEEKKTSRGRLKIFFGSSAGVGKTYAMLKAAHEQLEQGCNVLVGIVETHKRPETEALLEGLLVLPTQEINYRGMILREMDIDAALTRNPDIVLVDELAHTNAPGSRHPKRWNDVEELLAAGIDVYTTLNVQHIESLSDLVAGTTGVWVKETVPDLVFDTAEDVVLVDLDEDDLIQRLHEGKVYVAPGAMARASENFFRKSNLNALRELALRRTADRVGAERYADRSLSGEKRPVSDKILACINADPMSGKLIRSAKRLSTGLKAPWLVATVETDQTIAAADERRRQLSSWERMINRMGGKLVTLQGEDVASAVLTYARQEHVTKIVIGKKKTSRLRAFWGDHIINRLIRFSGSIDVYVVTEEDVLPIDRKPVHTEQFRWLDYSLAVFAVVGLSIPGLMLPHIVTATDQALLYLTGIVAVSASLGLGPALLYSILSAGCLETFFLLDVGGVTPRHRPALFTFMLSLVTGYVIARQSSRLRNQAFFASKREDQSRSLFEVTRKLASTHGRFPVSEVVAKHINKALNSDVTIWMTNEEGLPSVVLGNLPEKTYHKDFGALQWSYEHAQNAGLGTETMPSASGAYFPLISSGGTLGVLGVYPREDIAAFGSEATSNIEMLASLLASALDRVRAGEALREAMVQQESDRLKASLLKAATGDFRVTHTYPSASETASEPTKIDPDLLKTLSRGLDQEAFRLSKSVQRFMNVSSENLTALQVNRRPTSLADRVKKVIERVKDHFTSLHLQVNITSTLPDISVDIGMCEQALATFLLFLSKTAPDGSRLSLSAVRKGASVVLEIIQERSNLPEGLQQSFFDRLSTPEQGELSALISDLGVAASLVRLHGGDVQVEALGDGSATLCVSFPIA